MDSSRQLSFFVPFMDLAKIKLSFPVVYFRIKVWNYFFLQAKRNTLSILKGFFSPDLRPYIESLFVENWIWTKNWTSMTLENNNNGKVKGMTLVLFIGKVQVCEFLWHFQSNVYFRQKVFWSIVVEESTTKSLFSPSKVFFASKKLFSYYNAEETFDIILLRINGKRFSSNAKLSLHSNCPNKAIKIINIL